MAQSSVVLEAPAAKKTLMDNLLDGVETLGNKVPHPVLMFVYLIAFVIVLSSVLALLGVSVTEQVVEPVPYEVSRDFYADTTEVQTVAPPEGLEWSDVSFESQHVTIPIKGLLTIEGI